MLLERSKHNRLEMENTKEEILQSIDKVSKAIINMGPQLRAISPNLNFFDFFLISSLNRTVNLNKAFTALMRDNNFIAAAPLVRLNLDSLLRLFAARISENDMNEFAKRVYHGETIRKMKSHDKKGNLTDKYLVDQLEAVGEMEWIRKVYDAGNSFVHFSENLIYASRHVGNDEERMLHFTIGFHDSFIPENEKIGAAFWMNKINSAIIQQGQVWMLEKANAVGFDIEKLNDSRLWKGDTE